MDAAMFVKSAVIAPLDRPVSNLLQEVPEKLAIRRFSGTSDALVADRLEAPGTLTIGEILSSEPQEQALIVLGRKARLLAYFDPESDQIFVTRETVEIPLPPKKKTATRRGSRAGKAVAQRTPRAPKGRTRK